MNNLQPKKEHKFTFGLWTVRNPGRDPFGEPTRQQISPVTIVKRLSELGAYGVNFHDNDLVPIDASAAERDKIVGEFKKGAGRLRNGRPDGDHEPLLRPGFQGRRVHVERPARPPLRGAKNHRSMDLGAEVGAKIYVFWGGREGAGSTRRGTPARPSNGFARR